MPEPLILLVLLAVAGVFVLAPLRRPAAAQSGEDDLAAAEVRHRAAIEALRDVEADRRSGSLDDNGFAAQVAEAVARAAVTRAAIDRFAAETPRQPVRSRGIGIGIAAAGAIGALLMVGAFVPASGIPNATTMNQALADAQARETARQERIDDLLTDLAADPRDPETLSDLADAYLAGSSPDELARAAAALQLLINAEPERADAYERLMTAYLRAGDFTDARAVHDAYAALEAADPAETAFFDGLIALRGEDDPSRAAAAFDRFLELAPDDPRAGMVEALREEAGSP
jgi:cytochrome c-type biogenesis protein CcmH/NrfG